MVMCNVPARLDSQIYEGWGIRVSSKYLPSAVVHVLIDSNTKDESVRITLLKIPNLIQNLQLVSRSPSEWINTKYIVTMSLSIRISLISGRNQRVLLPVKSCRRCNPFQ